MVWWRFDTDINRCFLAILELQSGFLKTYQISMRCYFLVKKNGDKWENIRIKIKLKSERI